MIFDESKSILEKIAIKNPYDISLAIKREDLIHPTVSGNKYRKLKYNLEKAKSKNHDTLLTFGGAFSNHIAAVAAVGHLWGFKTVGIIRGEEIATIYKKNPTLRYAEKCGMTFKFISRGAYHTKNSKNFKLDLEKEFGRFYILPEGGTNELAVKGCEEILDTTTEHFDYICCSVGTGGTLAGLINCSKPRQQVLGFSALKGSFLKDDIAKFVTKDNWNLINDYNFGGYAKVNEELIGFINDFKAQYNIPLDPIYTGKMMYGIFDLIKKGYFRKNTSILAIHTGGLQGIDGMNKKLKNKNLTQLQ